MYLKGVWEAFGTCLEVLGGIWGERVVRFEGRFWK